MLEPSHRFWKAGRRYHFPKESARFLKRWDGEPVASPNLQHYLIALWRSLYSTAPARSQFWEKLIFPFYRRGNWYPSTLTSLCTEMIEGKFKQRASHYKYPLFTLTPLLPPLQDYVYLRLGLSSGRILWTWGWGDYDSGSPTPPGSWFLEGIFSFSSFLSIIFIFIYTLPCSINNLRGSVLEMFPL